jgi:cytochrome c553
VRVERAGGILVVVRQHVRVTPTHHHLHNARRALTHQPRMEDSSHSVVDVTIHRVGDALAVGRGLTEHVAKFLREASSGPAESLFGSIPGHIAKQTAALESARALAVLSLAQETSEKRSYLEALLSSSKGEAMDAAVTLASMNDNMSFQQAAGHFASVLSASGSSSKLRLLEVEPLVASDPEASSLPIVPYRRPSHGYIEELSDWSDDEDDERQGTAMLRRGQLMPSPKFQSLISLDLWMDAGHDDSDVVLPKGVDPGIPSPALSRGGTTDRVVNHAGRLVRFLAASCEDRDTSYWLTNSGSDGLFRLFSVSEVLPPPPAGGGDPWRRLSSMVCSMELDESTTAAASEAAAPFRPALVMRHRATLSPRKGIVPPTLDPLRHQVDEALRQAGLSDAQEGLDDVPLRPTTPFVPSIAGMCLKAAEKILRQSRGVAVDWALVTSLLERVIQLYTPLSVVLETADPKKSLLGALLTIGTTRMHLARVAVRCADVQDDGTLVPPPRATAVTSRKTKPALEDAVARQRVSSWQRVPLGGGDAAVTLEDVGEALAHASKAMMALGAAAGLCDSVSSIRSVQGGWREASCWYAHLQLLRAKLLLVQSDPAEALAACKEGVYSGAWCRLGGGDMPGLRVLEGAWPLPPDEEGALATVAVGTSEIPASASLLGVELAVVSSVAGALIEGEWTPSGESIVHRVAAAMQLALSVTGGAIVNGAHVLVAPTWTSVAPAPMDRLASLAACEPVGVRSHCSRMLRLVHQGLCTPLDALERKYVWSEQLLQTWLVRAIVAEVAALIDAGRATRAAQTAQSAVAFCEACHAPEAKAVAQTLLCCVIVDITTVPVLTVGLRDALWSGSGLRADSLRPSAVHPEGTSSSLEECGEEWARRLCSSGLRVVREVSHLLSGGAPGSGAHSHIVARTGSCMELMDDVWEGVEFDSHCRCRVPAGNGPKRLFLWLRAIWGVLASIDGTVRLTSATQALSAVDHADQSSLVRDDLWAMLNLGQARIDAAAAAWKEVGCRELAAELGLRNISPSLMRLGLLQAAMSGVEPASRQRHGSAQQRLRETHKRRVMNSLASLAKASFDIAVSSASTCWRERHRLPSMVQHVLLAEVVRVLLAAATARETVVSAGICRELAVGLGATDPVGWDAWVSVPASDAEAASASALTTALSLPHLMRDLLEKLEEAPVEEQARVKEVWRGSLVPDIENVLAFLHRLTRQRELLSVKERWSDRSSSLLEALDELRPPTAAAVSA